MFTNTHTYTHTASWDPATVLHAVCNHPTGMVHTVQGDPPPMWGPQSDAIGAAVVTLLQRDPRKFDQVAGRLHGRQLPGSLRAYMWADVLLKAERKRMKEV